MIAEWHGGSIRDDMSPKEYHYMVVEVWIAWFMLNLWTLYQYYKSQMSASKNTIERIWLAPLMETR